MIGRHQVCTSSNCKRANTATAVAIASQLVAVKSFDQSHVWRQRFTVNTAKTDIVTARQRQNITRRTAPSLQQNTRVLTVY